MTSELSTDAPKIIFPKSVGLLVSDKGELILAVSQSDGSADLFRISEVEARCVAAMINAVIE